MRALTLACAVAPAALALGCAGGGSPTGPTTAFVPGGAFAPGTVLSLTIAEGGQPADAARVVVAGRTYAADSAGRVILDQPVSSGTLVDIVAPGMLDRQTLLRTPSSTAFTLWPRSSDTGLDENYTRDLVYSWGDDQSGNSPLYRLAGTQAFLVPSAALRADGQAMAQLHLAAERLTSAVSGAVRYAVATDPPPGAIVFESVLDPKDAGCDERVLAFTTIRLRAGEIASGKIVFCTPGAAHDGTVIHEVGHTFGLGHSADADEVMHAYKLLRQPDGFGARESQVMRLMLQRRGGNRFPDNDRGVTAAATGEVTIVCR
jgi:hypothetical protein